MLNREFGSTRAGKRCMGEEPIIPNYPIEQVNHRRYLYGEKKQIPQLVRCLGDLRQPFQQLNPLHSFL